MTAFDPYRKWLGIPSEEQPPSYYRLLGIPDFETDLDVIESAADRQTIYLRTFQTGPNSELAEGLLNEVSLARVCLLQPAEKAKYDQQLKAKYDQQLQADQVPPPMVEGPPLGSEVSLPGPTEEGVSVEVKPGLGKVASRSARAGRRRSRRRSVKPLWRQPMVHVLGIVCLGLLLLILANLGGSGKRASVVPRNTRPDKNNRLENPDQTPQPDPGSGDKAAAEKLAAEKAAAAKAAAEKAAAEKAAAEKAAAEKAAAAKAAAEKAADAPQPVPDKDEVEKQKKKVMEAYSDRVAEARKLLPDKKGYEALKELAEEILASELENNDGDEKPPEESCGKELEDNAGDGARRYAVYEIVYQLAKESGDSALTFELVSEWKKEFLIDAWQYRLDALDFWTKNKLDTKSHLKLIKIIVEQAEAATREITPQGHPAEITEKLYILAYKEYDRLISRLVKKPETRSAAKRLVGQRKRVGEAKKQITALLAALAKLKEDSADGKANEVVGTFFAFVRRDWKIALPYLTQAEDEEFREAAKLDLANATNVAGQFKIGAAWLNIGKKRAQEPLFDLVEEQARSALYQRAAFWYQKVLKQGGGSYKNRIAAGLPDVPAALRGEPLPANGFFDRDEARKFQEAWSYYLDFPIEIGNSSGIFFVLIPPGKFKMGTLIAVAPGGVLGSDDFTQKKTINEPFYIGRDEVRQGEYAGLGLPEPDSSKFKGPFLPVDYMSWSVADRSCRNLTGKAANEGKPLTYRLPTEAEWEYAARAGHSSDYAPANSPPRNYAVHAWFKANSQGHTWPVGKKAPNQWGLYDMQGNVSEWCQGQVARGTNYDTGFGRVSYRKPSSSRLTRREGTGFRVVVEIPPNDLQKAAKRREMVSMPPLEAAPEAAPERNFFTRPEDE